MKNLFGYNSFVYETKKEPDGSVTVFNNDVSQLLSDMFDKVKKPKFKYDKKGYATQVEFVVEKLDYDLDYSIEKICCEYTNTFLAKKEFIPTLIFVSKHILEEKYFMIFDIEKEKVDLNKIKEKEKSDKLDMLDTKQLLSKLKSKNTPDEDKENIMDELERRGEEYDDPFEKKKKKKKSTNESVQSSEEYYSELRDPDHIDSLLSEMGFGPIMHTQYPEEFENSELFSADMTDEEYANAIADFINDNNDEPIVDEPIVDEPIVDEPIVDEPIVEGLIGKIAKLLSKTEYNKTLNYIENTCEEDCTKEDIKKCINKMVFSKITKKELSEDSMFMNSLVDELHKDFKKKCKTCESVESDEPIVEGLIGKIAKFLSKTEYNKTLDHIIDNCKDDCTKEDVKKCVNKMVFSKITKKELSEDSILMNSLVDELYKDFKKKCEKCESFGTIEWAKKYGVVLEEEKTEYSLEYMINESLKNEPESDETYENIFTNIYESNKEPRTLETLKKG